MTKKLRYTDGYVYLKSGDETGDLCYDCGSPMFIDKTGGRKWLLRCHCGRVIPFVSNNDATSAYK